jgi:5'(3')-deoxyribonucleotidase
MGVPSRCELNIFVDSDGVNADFEKMKHKLGMNSETFKYEPGAYTYLEPMPGAEAAMAWLKGFDDAGLLRVWIATKTPAGAPYTYSEKVLWYRWKFPWLEDRVILIHDKSLLGDEHSVLIDDRPHKGNIAHFKGEFIHFGSAKYPGWLEVRARLEEIINAHQRKSHVQDV